ncbi:hypothetical protein PF010_g13651 [Phytophthora fragariae]|uniref:Uncharacterized protein n=1 Tax=Phytophthora fragariae TaxID=53985 RepID=A0A6G0KZW9_9STRA|nr:hypothetical protein PF010_g13651 [Phytophthora fragariae]KAE9221443.1 hypothetical protein PF004_g13049 [Phytophthora fragariae]
MICSTSLRKGSRCAPARKQGERGAWLAGMLGAGPCSAGTPRGFATATRPRNRSHQMVLHSASCTYSPKNAAANPSKR